MPSFLPSRRNSSQYRIQVEATYGIIKKHIFEPDGALEQNNLSANSKVKLLESNIMERQLNVMGNPEIELGEKIDGGPCIASSTESCRKSVVSPKVSQRQFSHNRFHHFNNGCRCWSICTKLLLLRKAFPILKPVRLDLEICPPLFLIIRYPIIN